MTETESKRQSVLCRREADGVAVVTIDRPERRNALNLEVKSASPTRWPRLLPTTLCALLC